MKINIIVAMDEKNGIGFENKLLWHIPKDLKWLKEKTMGKVIVMGRNCYEDIITYTNGKPLIGRTNVILTSKNIQTHKDFVILKTIGDLLEKYKNENEIYILGGGMIYQSFIDMADKLIITHVHSTYKADVFFPKIQYSKYSKIFEENNSENNINFTFCIYEKIT